MIPASIPQPRTSPARRIAATGAPAALASAANVGTTRLKHRIDQTLWQSFPANDPPAPTQLDAMHAQAETVR